jgi:hypothetical protein
MKESMMTEVVKGDFAKGGFEIGDRRAIALHEWMTSREQPPSGAEIKQEMARLKRIMPAPEDEPGYTPETGKAISPSP